MTHWKPPAPVQPSRGYASRKLAPMVEAFETRQMMDTGFGVIAGTAFLDPTGSQVLGTTSAYLPGATVDLYRDGASTPMATQLTDAKGGYSFQGLAPGNYVVRETPPAAYAATGTQVLSNFEKGTQVAANAIRVTVPHGTLYANYEGVVTDRYQVTNDSVGGVVNTDAIGGLKLSLGTAPGATDVSPTFVTFCLDDLHRISFEGGEHFVVQPQSSGQIIDTTGAVIPADRSGRIAFLYNHFGNSSLTNIQGPALQLAIWELLSDTQSEPDFSSGNFKVLGPVAPTDQATLDQVLAQAKSYFDLSAGKSEAAIYLKATPAIEGGATSGYQSMLVTGSFNFGNRPGTPPPPNDQTAKPASISGFVYCDHNQNGVKDAGEAPIPGVTVTLTGQDRGGRPITKVMTTDATGAYHFLNLLPGTYTLTETQPAGYLQGATTQGTPGNGTVSVDVIRNVTLAEGVNGQDNDFGEVANPVDFTQVRLYGIHQQQSQVVLNFNGALDPSSATNPANYTLTWLGKSDRLGGADNQTIPVRSATYDATTGTVTLTPAAHLNVHYHYLLTLNVAPANVCAPTVTATTVFGRAAVPMFNWHGTMVAAPAMTAAEKLRDARVASQALAAAAKGMPTAARGVSHGSFLKANPVAPQYGNGWSGSIAGNSLARLAAARKGAGVHPAAQKTR